MLLTEGSKDGYVDGIKVGVHEALDLAENAINVLNNHANDEFVLRMARHVLGEAGIDTKVSVVKDTFSRVLGYDREPSEFLPMTDAWKSQRRNTDVEMYCNTARFIPKPGYKIFMQDTAMERPLGKGNVDTLDDTCYDPALAPGPGDKIKIGTRNSDFCNLAAYNKAKQTDPAIPKAQFTSVKENIACTMDLCTWFMEKWKGDGWPIVDQQTVANWKTDGFTSTLLEGYTPVDRLKTLGVTMLHELTHTVQGGRLQDVNAPDCYGWICVGRMRNERNSDSIAMLGIAMKVWTLGNYIEDDGTIHAIPA